VIRLLHSGECTFGHSWAVRFRKRHNLPTRDQNGRKRKRVLGDGEDGDDMGDGDDGDDEAAVDHLLLNGGVPGECLEMDCVPRVCAVYVWSCVNWRTVSCYGEGEICCNTPFFNIPLIR
jgi:hypothetical protein